MKIRSNGPGIGDSMFLSAVAYEWHRQRGDRLEVCCSHEELFRHSLDAIHTFDPTGAVEFPELHDQGSIKEHNVQLMCRKLGLSVPKYEALRQRIYFDPSEATKLRHQGEYLTLHAGTGPWTPNKNWYHARWVELAKRLLGDDPSRIIVQLGGIEEEILHRGVVDSRGVGLRTVASILAGSMLHVCCVTGTMHMASAVNTKAVVIFGGRESARVTGYANNINLEHHAISCAPCWKVEPCPLGHRDQGEFRRPCIDPIDVDTVQGIIGKEMRWLSLES